MNTQKAQHKPPFAPGTTSEYYKFKKQVTNEKQSTEKGAPNM